MNASWIKDERQRRWLLAIIFAVVLAMTTALAALTGGGGKLSEMHTAQLGPWTLQIPASSSKLRQVDTEQGVWVYLSDPGHDDHVDDAPLIILAKLDMDQPLSPDRLISRLIQQHGVMRHVRHTQFLTMMHQTAQNPTDLTAKVWQHQTTVEGFIPATHHLGIVKGPDHHYLAIYIAYMDLPSPDWNRRIMHMTESVRWQIPRKPDPRKPDPRKSPHAQNTDPARDAPGPADTSMLSEQDIHELQDDASAVNDAQESTDEAR